MSYQKIEVERRSPHLGAWVRGVDLREDLEDDIIAEIRRALLEFHVIFFRDQPISGEQHLAFAARFGELDNPHPVFANDAEVDRRLTIVESKGRPADGEHYWHTDVSYQENPSLGSILAAKKIPDTGGDTLFASMHAAYDALSPPLQRLCEELTAQHSIERGWGTTMRMYDDGEDRVHNLRKRFPLMTHPVLRTHPESGRTSLYVNEYYTSRINELSEPESEALLRLLHHHAQLPDFQVRHTWQTNDIAFWDNRCTQHYASHDYGAAHRVMNRVTLVGDRPYFEKPAVQYAKAG